MPHSFGVELFLGDVISRQEKSVELLVTLCGDVLAYQT